MLLALLVLPPKQPLLDPFAFLTELQLCALVGHAASIVMLFVVDQTWIICLIDGKLVNCPFLLQCFWLFSIFHLLVRAVTVTSFAAPLFEHRLMSGAQAMSAVMYIAHQAWLIVAVVTYLISGTHGSFLESILQMAQLHLDQEGNQRPLDAQWQFTFQTYGLNRPSRDGVIQVFRAVTSHIGPAMPAILSIPVSAADSPDQVLELVERDGVT